MGLRFRKSIKVAPGVKVNLNKKSTSVTFSGKGVHKTISSTGKKTSSIGIPGTGMYYTSSSGSGSNKHSSAKQLHESNNNIGENIPQQASAPNASLEKFSTDSLQHYKTIFLVLSIIAYLLTVMCFFNSSYLFGFFLLLVGLFSTGTYKTYSGEISNRLNLFSSSGGSGNVSSGNSSGSKYKSPKKKGCGCLTGIIIFILIIGLAGSCSDSDKEDSSKKNTASKKVTAVESITLSADTSTVYDINTEIPIDMAVNPADGNIDKLSCESSGGVFKNQDGKLTFSADSAGTYDLSVSCGNVKSNSLTISIEDKAAIAAAEAQKQAEEAAAQQSEQEQIVNDQPVAQQPQTSSYVVNTSTGKFHIPSCRDVNKIKQENYWAYEGTRDDLIAQGYSPCGHCNP